jgi:hypothetical protein
MGDVDQVSRVEIDCKTVLGWLWACQGLRSSEYRVLEGEGVLSLIQPNLG